MTDQRLRSGMKASEAIKLAEQWWTTKGRQLAQRINNTEREAGRFRPAAGGLPAIAIRGNRRPSIRSGILTAQPWAMLTKREQLQVVKAWHHWYVVLPTLHPDDYPADSIEAERVIRRLRGEVDASGDSGGGTDL